MSNEKIFGVGLIGAGNIGARRAEMASREGRTRLVSVADTNLGAAQAIAAKFGVPQCESSEDAATVIGNAEVDIVVVSTPNDRIAEYSIAALHAGKHVLCEKPPGRNLQEAEAIARVAAEAPGTFKIGFNHRYYPGLIEAQRLVREGAIGSPMYARVVYGHGGRPGYENEWRMQPAISGGGQLVDQGVHTIDLVHWFFGEIARVMAHLPTYFYPAPVEDNSFLMMWTPNGQTVQCHLSLTEWRNRFEFQVFGTDGYVRVQGLAKSYGAQTLVYGKRSLQGGAPAEQAWEFPNADPTWELEWQDFLTRIAQHTPNRDAARQGVAVMQVLQAAYASAQAGVPVPVD